MIKKSTRNAIGATLIWLGLIAYAGQVGYLIWRGVKEADSTMLTTGWVNAGIILAIMFGGVWGMKK